MAERRYVAGLLFAAAIPLRTIAMLAEAFDDSGLPWKVDLVDRCAVSDSFGMIIDETQKRAD
jgi:hypothetical protein